MGDYDMAIKISSKYKVSCVQQPLATYRWHGGNESISHRELGIKELERWSIEMKKYPEISKCPLNFLKLHLVFPENQRFSPAALCVIFFIFSHCCAKSLTVLRP